MDRGPRRHLYRRRPWSRMHTSIQRWCANNRCRQHRREARIQHAHLGEKRQAPIRLVQRVCKQYPYKYSPRTRKELQEGFFALLRGHGERTQYAQRRWDHEEDHQSPRKGRKGPMLRLLYRRRNDSMVICTNIRRRRRVLLIKISRIEKSQCYFGAGFFAH